MGLESSINCVDRFNLRKFEFDRCFPAKQIDFYTQLLLFRAYLVDLTGEIDKRTVDDVDCLTNMPFGYGE